jgi:segregation and condensation protein A
MATPYKITIPMYEGPLDLLLDLIKKQEMNIHDIPIAKITSQYLEYLHKLDELNVDVSADFIYMAATLIYIKSKMLLPPDPLAGPEDQTDRLKRTCGRSRTSRSITTRGRRASWSYRWST